MLSDRGDLCSPLVVCGADFGRRSVEADTFTSNLDGIFLIGVPAIPVGNQACLEGAFWCADGQARHRSPVARHAVEEGLLDRSRPSTAADHGWTSRSRRRWIC